jgi:hypothetical protein
MRSIVLSGLFLLMTLLVKAQVAPTMNDHQLLLGNWGIQETKKNGELAMSIDSNSWQKIINSMWTKDSLMFMEMGLEKDVLAESFIEQCESLSKVTFTFDEDGVIKVSPNDGESDDVFSRYTMNEKKKELSIEEQNEEEDELIYSYSFFEDQLILKQEEGDELIFKRIKP